MKSIKENEDYELIIGEDDFWNIRILSGPYTETVYQYNHLKLDEKTDTLRFNASIISTPDDDLSENDVEFQKYIGEILFDILENENG
jgi:hypothetical protein